MIDAINDLSKSRPHMRTTARFDPAQLRAYQEGYYWGVTYALRVAVEAIDRFKLRTRTVRADAKAKRSA